jgi:hypothetical protein
MKTSELTGAALDWAVAKCEKEAGMNVREGYGGSLLVVDANDFGAPANYSTDWAQGGPIIEREKLCLDIDSAGVWLAWTKQNYDDEPRHMVSGPTPLIAAMRCYVASELGDTVELPEGLK